MRNSGQVLWADPYGPPDAVIGELAALDLAANGARGYVLKASRLVDRKQRGKGVCHHGLIHGWAPWSDPGRRDKGGNWPHREWRLPKFPTGRALQSGPAAAQA